MDFEVFFQGEYERVYRGVFVSCGDPEVAADATQEAFERAYARWRRLQREPWLGGWVMTTALNAARTMKRREGRSVELPSDLGVGSIPEGRVDLVRALRKLSPRQREVMVLHYISDLPIAAVAHLMGVAEGTVKAQLSQGRAALRRALEVSGV